MPQIPCKRGVLGLVAVHTPLLIAANCDGARLTTMFFRLLILVGVANCHYVRSFTIVQVQMGTNNVSVAQIFIS